MDDSVQVILVFFASRGVGLAACRDIICLKGYGLFPLITLSEYLDRLQLQPQFWNSLEASWKLPELDYWLRSRNVQDIHKLTSCTRDEYRIIINVRIVRVLQYLRLQVLRLNSQCHQQWSASILIKLQRHSFNLAKVEETDGDCDEPDEGELWQLATAGFDITRWRRGE